MAWRNIAFKFEHHHPWRTVDCVPVDQIQHCGSWAGAGGTCNPRRKPSWLLEVSRISIAQCQDQKIWTQVARSYPSSQFTSGIRVRFYLQSNSLAVRPRSLHHHANKQFPRHFEGTAYNQTSTRWLCNLTKSSNIRSEGLACQQLSS